MRRPEAIAPNRQAEQAVFEQKLVNLVYSIVKLDGLNLRKLRRR